MALVVADRVKVRTFTDGTSPFLIEGTFQGHQGFDAIGDGNETYYGIFDVAGNWEIGRGTYTASTSLLTRETIISSSNNNLIVDFPGGGKTLYSTLPSSVANSIIAATVSDSFKNIAISGQGTLVADSSTDTLTIVAGIGVGLETNPTTDTLTISCTGDIKGSIFADDSTMLIDGTEGKIVGPIETTSLRTTSQNIALGFEAGSTNQAVNATAVGGYAGATNQAAGAVAIGSVAGSVSQAAGAVGVGYAAGGTNQSVAAVAVGYGAGTTNQGNSAVAVGYAAGATDQKLTAVAIGFGAGQLNQGEASIAIGYAAGTNNQPDHSIVLNASGNVLDGSAAGLFIDPIRNISGGTFLNYNPSTKEIGYDSDLRSEGNINIEINLSDSTQYRWQFGEDGELTFPDGTAQTTAWDVNNVDWSSIVGIAIQNNGLPVLPTQTLDITGSVFADDSTLLVNGVDGSLAYYPTTAGDWNGTPPSTVGEALDRLATLVKALNGGTGA